MDILTNFWKAAAEAARLRRIIDDLGESKNSRNAAITLLRKLERESGFKLRED